MKTDARVRYTQMVIKESFFSLLKEKPLNRITVKEICERSSINRATFYHHYKDPYDLLEQLENHMLESLQEALEKENLSDMQSFYEKILNSMKENGDWYIAVAAAKNDRDFSVRVFLSCYRTMFPDFAGRFPNLDETDRRLLYHFLAQGCSGIMNYWFKSGMKESPEVIAKFLLEANRGICDHFLRYHA